MRKKRISMDKIREIIRLSQELNLGCRKIAQAFSISKTAVNGYIAVYIATPNISTSLVSIKEGFYQYIFLITSLFAAMEFW